MSTQKVYFALVFSLIFGLTQNVQAELSPALKAKADELFPKIFGSVYETQSMITVELIRHNFITRVGGSLGVELSQAERADLSEYFDLNFFKNSEIFQKLLPEVLLQVFEKLSRKDICRTTQASKDWARLGKKLDHLLSFGEIHSGKNGEKIRYQKKPDFEFSEDSRFLYVLDRDQKSESSEGSILSPSIRVFNSITGQEVTSPEFIEQQKKFLKSGVSIFSLAHDGKSLIIVENGGRVLIWDPVKKEMSPKMSIASDSDSPDSLSFSEDRRYLAAGKLGGGSVSIWNVENGTEESKIQLPGPGRLFMAPVFSPDGNQIAIPQKQQPDQPGLYTILLADLSQKSVAIKLMEMPGTGPIRWTYDGRHLLYKLPYPAVTEVSALTGRQSKSITAFAWYEKMDLIRTFKKDPIFITFSHPKNVDDGHASEGKIWIASTGRQSHSVEPLLKVFPLGQEEDLIQFSEDDRFFIGITKDNQLGIWNLGTGRLEGRTSVLTNEILKIRLSKQGDRVALFEKNGKVGLWGIQFQNKIHPPQINLNGTEELLISKDKTVLDLCQMLAGKFGLAPDLLKFSINCSSSTDLDLNCEAGNAELGLALKDFRDLTDGSSLEVQIRGNGIEPDSGLRNFVIKLTE